MLLWLVACGLDADVYWWGSYDEEARVLLPAPANTGEAPFAGSLGPPAVMVEPVLLGTTTTTREGSGGPPILRPGETQPAPTWRIEGPDDDGHRITPDPARHR